MPNPVLQLKWQREWKLKTCMNLLCCSLTSLYPGYCCACRILLTLEGRIVLLRQDKPSFLQNKSLGFTIVKCLNALFPPFKIKTDRLLLHIWSKSKLINSLYSGFMSRHRDAKVSVQTCNFNDVQYDFNSSPHNPCSPNKYGFFYII